MSGAICGYINLNYDKSSLELGNKMIEKFQLYELDKIDYMIEDNVYMACGLLNVDNNFSEEILPYYDEEMKVYITADAAIYNRDELKEKLNIEVEKLTDSKLILESYKKWGRECPKYLVGDFSFAIWDTENNELFCARDHTGNRTFYYRYDKDRVCFSTLINPIAALYNKELNEEWIVEYLSLPGAVQEMNPKTTLYKDIKQLPPASIMIVKNNNIEIKKYWEPLRTIKKLKLKSDEEYAAAFKKVFFESVKCRIKSNKDIGIMVSGGLDSGSIACVAAKMLKKENKRLKGYSSIPLKSYKRSGISDYYITDESEYVKELALKYDNIDLNFCRCEGKSALSDVDKFIEVLEQPYKIFTNIVWLNEIQHRANNDGCKVILKGQYGNSTISFGNLETHIKTLFSEGKLYQIYKEINGVCRIQHISKKFAIKQAAKVLYPYKLKRIIKHNDNSKYIDNLIVKKELVEKWDINKKFKENYYDSEEEIFHTLNEVHKLIVRDSAFSQIGAMETKLSLYNGVVLRDPSRDKRIIEFCLSLPSEQFVREGVERYLIRGYMKGILPDKIRLNMTQRGYQSADWIQRIKDSYEDMLNEILSKINMKSSRYYLRTEDVKNEIENRKNDYKNLDKYIISFIFLTFLKNNECAE